VSDSNKPKPLPPDDFGATTPNIKIPKTDLPSSGTDASSDWEKTNYNYSPKDLGRDEWNKTAYNIPKSNTPPPAKDAEWGMTGLQINLPNNQRNQAFDDDDFGEKRDDYGKTSAGLSLPRNEIPPQYQEPPSAKSEKEQTKKGGIPGWVWASAGLLGMFLFAVMVLLAVYFIFLGKTGFDVVIKGPPQVRSEVYVNGSQWSVTGADGTIRLLGLKAGEEKNIVIKNPDFNCEVKAITTDEAKDGKVIERSANCPTAKKVDAQQTAPPECLNIKAGDFATSRRCANTELDKLEKAGTWTVDQLLYAMNLYIINFDRGKWDIKPDDMKFVERASNFMKKLPPSTVIEVGGHTDSDGTDQDNQKLSDNRSNSVKDALLKLGISQSMLKSQGYGEKRPKDGNTNANPDEKFRNRRIEYTVLAK
jgi:outer membrane protein OmpA-like peptidoglycan-associated protein